MLCLSGFELYSRWVPLIRISTSDFENLRLKVIDVEISVKLIQKCAMLGPAKIF